jgi:photosystem II stability/assembly factor-like uncharacterized protein
VRIHTCLTLLCALAALAYAGWFWQNPRPTGNDVVRVWCATTDTVFALDARGAVLRSTDGDSSWSMVRPIGMHDAAVNDIQFPAGGSSGYALGAGNVWKTTDAGLSWTSIPPQRAGLRALEFVAGADSGFAAGTWNVNPYHTAIYRTTNGGSSWDSFTDPHRWDINDISFATSMVGYAAGATATSGAILKTTDAGATWSLDSTDLPPITAICFPQQPQTGYLCARWAYKSTDGGANWTRLGLDTMLYYNGVWFPAGPDTGYVLGDDSLLFRTFDQGAHWTSLPVAYGLKAFHFPKLHPQTGCAVGTAGRLLTSSDYGATWTTRTPERVGLPLLQLLDVQFPSDRWRGYACGFSGAYDPPTLLRTTDGGAEWAPCFYADSLALFYALAFPQTADTGFVVGADSAGAAVWKTVNGGSDWNPVLTNAAARGFQDIDFPSGPDTGYVLEMFSGAVWKTTDRGDTWVRHTMNVTMRPVAFDFPTATCGYAVGLSGRVARTTDGGQTWTRLDLGLTSDLYGVAFPGGPDTGFVAGGSALLRTTDAGASWSDPIYPPSGNIHGIAFCRGQSRYGYYVTGEGAVIGTTDGGASWQVSFQPCSELLWSVYFLGDTTLGWAVGSHGTILATTPGSSGIAEQFEPERRPARLAATIIRGVLWLNSSFGIHNRNCVGHSASLLDASGRRVLDLHPGPNDVSRLAPGVYFVRSASGVMREALGVRKVLVTR